MDGQQGRVSQLGTARRVGVCPPVSHPGGLRALSGVLAGGWTGTGGAPSIGRVEPKLCKGCVWAACTSRGCSKVRNDVLFMSLRVLLPLCRVALRYRQNSFERFGYSRHGSFLFFLYICPPPTPPGLCCSHQDLLSSLWQAQGEQTPSHQGGGGQEDGNHLGDPHEGGKDGVPQDGTKLAKPIEDAKGCCPGEEKQKAMVRREVLTQLQKVWMGNFINDLILHRVSV